MSSPSSLRPSNANITTSRRLSGVWLIPLFALIASTWIVVKHYLDRGPEIQMEFATAEGIVAGKTQIRALNVEVGVVERVELNEDLENVTIYARIDPKATDLLRQDTQFWVVKPQIGSRGISGLSTLFSGAFIELAPGDSYSGKRLFKGLNNPPLTPGNKKGTNVFLVTDMSASLKPGAPVLHNGFNVGKITFTEVLPTGKVRASAFVEAPYDKLLSSNSRFFNASGFEFKLTPEGMDFSSESLESLLTGGVAFAVPTSLGKGQAISDGREFHLYKNKQQIDFHPFQYSVEFLLLFESSVRGLIPGAPVEYRGIRIGSVREVSFDLLSPSYRKHNIPKVPVLIKLDPGRLLGDDSPEAEIILKNKMAEYVKQGLKAALVNASLVTGQRIISLDYYPELPSASISKVEGHTVIPSTTDEISHVISRVGTFVDKLNQLPINETFVNANQSLAKLNAVLISADDLVRNIDAFVSKGDLQDIPQNINVLMSELRNTMRAYSPNSPFYQSLNQTLLQLQQSLKGIESITDGLTTKPNSLIFSELKSQDPIPGRGLELKSGDRGEDK